MFYNDSKIVEETFNQKMKLFENIFKDEGIILMNSVDSKTMPQNTRNKYVSNSLEKAESHLMNGLKEKSETEKNESIENIKQETSKNVTETQKNEQKNLTQTTLVFEKCIPPPVKKRRSMISETIRRSMKNNTKVNSVKALPKDLDYTVFLEYGRPLKIRIKNSETVKKLMLVASLQHKEQFRHPPLKDLSFYALCICDKDGNIDEKIPPRKNFLFDSNFHQINIKKPNISKS